MLTSEDGVVLQAFNLRDVVGKNIVCDDGVKRRVEQITRSQRYADKVLVNEINEDETPGGAFVHVLSLHCQMFGLSVPTKEQMHAFSRAMRAFRWQPDPNEVPGTITLPSGIIVPQ